MPVLSDSKLTRLLSLRVDPSLPLFEMAIQEARKRNLAIPINTFVHPVETRTGDRLKLRKWNWAVFLMMPLWTLAHRLDFWTVLLFIPGVNVIVLFYLGLKGNTIAYEKSNLSVDEFMMLQKIWIREAIKAFVRALVLSLIAFLIASVFYYLF